MPRSPRTRGRNGRAARTRFVEVEMPAASASHLVIELAGGGRILLGEPAHVTLLLQLLAGVGGGRKGSRP
ncbi:MAG: hypothetical protein NTW21_24980 [Verrucomicrobia bacterium]|nr:hypothetical protein [Verrucomicrobiota bacterium]